jgi:hypothetical protein
VFTTALECLLNAMSLALDDNDFECLPDICGVAWVMSWNSQPHGVLPQDLCSLAHHYYDWIDLFSRFFDADFDHTHVQEALSDIDSATSIARPDYVYLKEDSDYLKDILVVSLWMKLAVYCRLLLMIFPSFRMDLLGASINVLQALGVANAPSPIRSSSTALRTCTAGRLTLLTTSALNSRRASSNTPMLPSKVRKLFLRR